jgi:hypothetical protein
MIQDRRLNKLMVPEYKVGEEIRSKKKIHRPQSINCERDWVFRL